MAVENITLNIIPTGDTPSIHVAQFDVDRHFTVTLKEGADDFTPTGYDIELQVRKVDSTIVTVVPLLTSGNVITFGTTEQMTACSGTNIAELQLTKDSQTFATLHFYLVVQRDVLVGGVTSESDIYNLTEQIAAIVPEVIGDDYYNKTEVDDLLDDKADKATTYTKTQVDSALALKADASNVYTKSQTDTLLNAKANTSDLATVATTGDYDDLIDKPDINAMITAALLEVMPVDTASGSIANFETELAVPLVNVSCNVVAKGGNGRPDNPNPINGYTEANITANGNVITIAFGQTVYGGVLDVTRGKLTVTHAIIDLGSLSWTYSSGTYSRFYSSGIANLIKAPETADTIPNMVASSYKVTSFRVAYQQQTNNVIAITETSSGSHGNINIVDNNYSDADVFKTAVVGQTLAYELATPFDIELTPEVISAVVGTNNVYSDTNGDTTVQFKDSIQHYIDSRV